MTQAKALGCSLLAIPLPENVALKRLFEIHIGDTPNDLTPDNFAWLGNRATGYSGADVSILEREALFAFAQLRGEGVRVGHRAIGLEQRARFGANIGRFFRIGPRACGAQYAPVQSARGGHAITRSREGS